MSLILLDNVLTNFFKGLFFKSRYVLEGKCKQCGQCCREIYLKMTPAQTSSPLFTKIAIKWIEWIFEFKLIRIDYEYNDLVFTCRNIGDDGKCRNYFWRPNVCRNYPLVDYFKEPAFLDNCGYSCKLR